MMKTPDEIKRGLKCCTYATCNGCPYAEDGCATNREMIDALDYIQQLENQIGKLEPVRHGLWIRCPDCGVTRCSVCDWSIEECFDSNFCPNCGARMDAEVKE